MEQKVIFICEDSLDGIFTAVYEGWQDAAAGVSVEIKTGEPDNLEFFCQYRSIKTNLEKSVKVARSIPRKLGTFTYETLCYAAVSNHPDKGTAVFQVLWQALSGGRCRRDILEAMADSYVNLVTKLRVRVWRELHHYFGFVRFREVGGSVLFSEIAPDNDILEMLAPHFSNRFPNEHWMIYDSKRNKVLLHPRKGTCSVQQNVTLSEEAKEQLTQSGVYEELWRAFCGSIAIQARKNPKLQQKLLPLKYRGEMPEFVE